MSLYKGNNLISGHQVLYSTTGNNTDGAMTQSVTTTELNGKADTDLSNLSATGQKVLDGQWVSISVTIMSGQSLNGSANLSYTLSGVPDDGYKYEVLLTGQTTSGTTAGNAVRLEVNSDAVTGVIICASQTRTTSSILSGGAVVLPLTNSRKIYVLRATYFNGTGTLYLRGYRRIGTNS